MNLTASVILLAVGFVATVTAPAGAPLTVAVLTLAAGGVWFANALADRLIP